MYECCTNPRLSGELSCFLKCGSVRCSYVCSIRWPFTFCCPTHAMICAILMTDPLEPPVTMLYKLFVLVICFCTKRPDVSRALFKILFMVGSQLLVVFVSST